MEPASDPELGALEASLRERGFEGAEVAFVLGSGLGAFAERLANASGIPFAELPGLSRSSVEGHAGDLLCGDLDGRRVLVQRGRLHLYEGRTAREVTRTVRAFALLGCRTLVLTNAAGGLRPDWHAGTLMRITDHLNLQGQSPLDPPEAAYGTPYDPAAGAALDAAAAETGIPLERGTYAGVLGPSYESPAEVRMLRDLGADAVGMSTVAEALAGAASGLRVAAISLITNPAAGLSRARLTHDDVLAAARAASERFCALLAASVRHLAAR